MNAPLTTAERYANSVSHGYSGDVVLAAGLSGGWATNLFRLKYANDAKEYKPTLARFKLLAIRISVRREWGTDPDRVKMHARRVFNYWLADTCPACFGRRYEAIAGTPMLSDTICPQCKGTGKRPWQEDKEWQERGADLLEYLNEAVRNGEANVRRKER